MTSCRGDDSGHWPNSNFLEIFRLLIVSEINFGFSYEQIPTDFQTSSMHGPASLERSYASVSIISKNTYSAFVVTLLTFDEAWNA